MKEESEGDDFSPGGDCSVVDFDMDECETDVSVQRSWDFPLSRHDKHLRVIDLYRKELEAVNKESDDVCCQLYREREETSRLRESEISGARNSALAEYEVLNRDLAASKKENEYLRTRNYLLIQQAKEAVQNAKEAQAKMDGERRDKQQLESIAHQLGAELQKNKNAHDAKVWKLESHIRVLEKQAREYKGTVSVLQSEIRSLLNNSENIARERWAFREELARAQEEKQEALNNHENSAHVAQALQEELLNAKEEKRAALYQLAAAYEKASEEIQQQRDQLQEELSMAQEEKHAVLTNHENSAREMQALQEEVLRAQEEKFEALKQLEAEHTNRTEMESAHERANQQIQQQMRHLREELHVAQAFEANSEDALQRAANEKCAALREVEAAHERATHHMRELHQMESAYERQQLEEQLHVMRTETVEYEEKCAALQHVEAGQERTAHLIREVQQVEAAHERRQLKEELHTIQIENVSREIALWQATSGYESLHTEYEEKCAALQHVEAGQERVAHRIREVQQVEAAHERHRLEEELHTMYENLRTEYMESMRIEMDVRSTNDALEQDAQQIGQQMHHLREEMHGIWAEKVDIHEELHIARAEKLDMEAALAQANLQNSYEDIHQELKIARAEKLDMEAALAQANLKNSYEDIHEELQITCAEKVDMETALAQANLKNSYEERGDITVEELSAALAQAQISYEDLRSEMLRAESAEAQRGTSAEELSAVLAQAQVDVLAVLRVADVFVCDS